MKLVLEDGTIFQGSSFGADREVGGEVVFNTAMTGYPELLTDPAYRGQILVLTYPLQGNYGIARGPFESDRIQVQGLVVAHATAQPHHHESVQSLEDWLIKEAVPGIQAFDTRSLVSHLRDEGTMRGFLLHDETRCEAETLDLSAVECVNLGESRSYPAGPLMVLAIDPGMRESALQSLVGRNVSVLRYPAMSSWEEVVSQVDGIILGSGPGDPASWRALTARISRLLEGDRPILGLCLGHQLLALAAGARTFKLSYGHRSVNQPVRDLRTQRAYSTSQNHGFAVDPSSLPADLWDVWCTNLLDGTIEGIRHRHRPFLGVQFHPESTPGPRDTDFLFDEFQDFFQSA